MLDDLRFAFRQLRKSPGFTFVAIATLAVLGSAAVVACLLPARRATLVDPIRALRTE